MEAATQWLFEHIEDADLNDELPLPTKPNRPADQFEHPDESVKPVPTPAGVPPPPGLGLSSSSSSLGASTSTSTSTSAGSSGAGGGDAKDALARSQAQAQFGEHVTTLMELCPEGVPLYRGHMEYLLTVVALGSMEEATTWLLDQIVSAPPDMRSGEPGRG